MDLNHDQTTALVDLARAATRGQTGDAADAAFLAVTALASGKAPRAAAHARRALDLAGTLACTG